MSALRIAMLTTFYPPHNFGGDGIGIQRLARGFARRGHEVTVIQDVDAHRALSTGASPRTNDVDEGVRVIRLRSALGTLSPLLTHQLGRPVVHGRRIRALLDEGGYDVTMFHNVSLVGGPGLLSEGRGVTLYEAHEHWLVCPTHVLWRHGREACTGRECLRCTLRAGRPPQLWRYTGHLDRQLDHVDAIIAKSEFSRAKHREFGLARDMEVIPYFLPDDEAPGGPTSSESPHDRPYFLFVGRLERIKGLDDVIPAWREHAHADLLIAGDGAHGEELRRLAAGAPNVHFLGRVAPDALRRYYEHATALIVPSVCFETFGIIIIEAFRQGTPVLARRIGPLPELIEAGGGGELFDDAAGLLRAVQNLAGDPARRASLAREARASFRRNWTEDAVIPRYLDLIDKCARRKGLGRVVEKLSTGSVA